MSRSYQRRSMGRAHFREYGAKTMRIYRQKRMRGLLKSFRDYDGAPILPRHISYGWPNGKEFRTASLEYLYDWIDDLKLPNFIGRDLRRLQKYKLSKEDIRCLYHWKIK